MGQALSNKRVAILATDGFEQVELTQPKSVVEKAGASVDIVSLKPGSIQGFHHADRGDRFDVDKTVEEVSVGDYDALVLPGGVHNPDSLRTHEGAVQLVRDFCREQKPVAAICHGPWLMVEADVVRGKCLTSFPSIKTDILNAGGDWVDETVVRDGPLITSRKPDDLDAFNAEIINALSDQS